MVLTAHVLFHPPHAGHGFVWTGDLTPKSPTCRTGPNQTTNIVLTNQDNTFHIPTLKKSCLARPKMRSIPRFYLVIMLTPIISPQPWNKLIEWSKGYRLRQIFTTLDTHTHHRLSMFHALTSPGQGLPRINLEIFTRDSSVYGVHAIAYMHVYYVHIIVCI